MSRGLPGQDVTVDRRHALLLFNDPLYHYINGVPILGGEIEVPVNSFYETSDGKWMCFNELPVRAGRAVPVVTPLILNPNL
jgi:hypothetical protein